MEEKHILYSRKYMTGFKRQRELEVEVYALRKRLDESDLLSTLSMAALTNVDPALAVNVGRHARSLSVSQQGVSYTAGVGPLSPVNYLQLMQQRPTTTTTTTTTTTNV